MLLHRQNVAGPNYIAGLTPAAWFRYNMGLTITGLGVSQWDDQSGNARPLLQGTDANRPIGLLHTGTNYLYLPGVAGNYASTPDSVASSVVSDIDIRVKLSMDDWTPAGAMTPLGKWDSSGADTRSYRLDIAIAGTLILYTSVDGAANVSATSTAATGVTDGATKWIRATRDVDNGAGGNTTVFYLSDDGTTWTQLGDPVVNAGTTSIFNSAKELTVGAYDASGSAAPVKGKIYRASIYSTIGGTTPVVDFNPALATDQAATFVASTGETWTINSTGSKPAQIVASSRLLGDGAAHKLATANYTANQARTRIALVYPISWTAADYLMSGTVAECGVTQVTGTPQIGLNAGAAAAANTGLTLGAWHFMCAIHNGASSSLIVDNGAATTGDNGAGNPGGLTLFSNQAGAGYFNGMFKEVMDFDRVLTATEISRVRQYINFVGNLGL